VNIHLGALDTNHIQATEGQIRVDVARCKSEKDSEENCQYAASLLVCPASLGSRLYLRLDSLETEPETGVLVQVSWDTQWTGI
jgi:hypothetical protein